MTIFDVTGTNPFQPQSPNPQPPDSLHPSPQFAEAMKAEEAKDGAADLVNGVNSFLLARAIEELKHDSEELRQLQERHDQVHPNPSPLRGPL
jgi:hypothetical protein